MLGDKRLDKTCSLLLDKQTDKGVVVIRQLSSDYKEEQRFGGFLQNDSYTVDTLGKHLLDCSDLSGAVGKHVLSVQDISEIDFSHRGSEDLGLGSIGNGLGYGFEIPPHLCLDADTGFFYGLGSLSHLVRQDDREKHRLYKEGLSLLNEADAKEARRVHKLASVRSCRAQTIEKKEGYSWLTSARESLGRLGGASCVTVVADCETDSYEYIVGLTDPAFKKAGHPCCKILVRCDNGLSFGCVIF